MPTYTREQVQHRRRVALGVLGLIALVVLASCGAGLSRLLSATSDPDRPGALQASATPAHTRRADPSALRVPAAPADAPILTQLPNGSGLENAEVVGVDVSAHQGEIDWAAVRSAGASFAYIKATEGVGHQDERLNQNWSGAHAAGLVRGAYHYFTLCSAGAEQADAFLAAVPPDDAALPPALDLELDGGCDEKPSRTEVAAQVEAFITAVEKSWGRQVVVYSSQEWRDLYPLPQDPAAGPRPVWVNSLGERPQGSWAMWQVRFDARVDGIAHDVDLDVLRTGQISRDAQG